MSPGPEDEPLDAGAPEPKIFLGVDVAQTRRHGHALVLEICERVGKGVRSRPADPGKGRRHPPLKSHQPVAAILRRSQHGIGAGEQSERLGNVDGTDGRDVAADDEGGTGRQTT